MLDAGRFAAEADALRLYRRIATMDAAAPLPQAAEEGSRLERGRRRTREELGLARLAGRLRGGARID